MADQTPPSTQTLENYLAYKPLNPAMEQLVREVMEDEAPNADEHLDIGTDPFDPLRPLDDADRKALLKVTQDPGWQVYQRIRRRACAQAEKAATLVSQDNPLSNQRKIAEGWAYLTVMRQVMKAEDSTIAVEINQLRPKQEAK